MLSGTKFFSLIVINFFSSSVIGEPFFNPVDFDYSVQPKDDFFTFVNGGWLNRTVVPSSKTEIGSVFSIAINVSNQLKSILDDLTNNGTSVAPHPVDSIHRKLGDLYLAGMDHKTVEKLGIKPLQEALIKINNIKTYEELISFVLESHKKINTDILFDFDVRPDPRNTLVYAVQWKQSGIILPERDYYFRSDQFSKHIRLTYRNYIDRLFNLTNHIIETTTNLADAEDVLTLEAQLAVSHYTPVQLRDPLKNYHNLSLAELDQMMPNLGWHRIFHTLEIPNDTVIFNQLDYYQSLDKLIISQPLNVWKNKVRFTYVHLFAPYLSDEFSDARYHMFQYSIFGRQQKPSRWSRILDDINEQCGDLLGQLYVQRYFPIEAKIRMLNLTNHLIEVYRNRLIRNEWMNEKTKEKALVKLNKMNKKIGYPSKWKTYENIHMNRWSYLESMLSIFENKYRTKMNDLYRSVNKDEWGIPAQIVNAFYLPTSNEIVFPAAILQEPFFNLDADDAINYGSVGSFIGHEMTHGFDDQGRKYDENGDLNQWWTPEDYNQFSSRTKILVQQFNDYKLFNLNVNGLLTLGENLADLGGLRIAFEAFQQTQQAKEGKKIDGLTPNERFFLSFARAIRVKFTDERLVAIIQSDPHAPPIFRVNGPLSNIKSFYDTFHVTKNDKMFREESQRVKVW